MKGRISKEGWLLIKRGKEMKKQLCPISAYGYERSNCGDWCPHFGEPYYVVGMKLELSCGSIRMWSFEEFKDERE